VVSQYLLFPLTFCSSHPQKQTLDNKDTVSVSRNLHANLIQASGYSQVSMLVNLSLDPQRYCGPFIERADVHSLTAPMPLWRKKGCLTKYRIMEENLLALS